MKKYTKQCILGKCNGRCKVAYRDAPVTYGTSKNPKIKKETLWKCDKCHQFMSMPKELRFTTNE